MTKREIIYRHLRENPEVSNGQLALVARTTKNVAADYRGDFKRKNPPTR